MDPSFLSNTPDPWLKSQRDLGMAPSGCEAVRDVLIGLTQRKASSMRIDQLIDTVAVDRSEQGALLKPVLDDLLATTRPDGKAAFSEVRHLSSLNTDDGWCCETHLVLLKRDTDSGEESALAVLRLAGGQLGKVEGFDITSGAFENTWERLNERHPYLPAMYGTVRDSASQKVCGLWVEFVPGPNLESALLQGLVTRDEARPILRESFEEFSRDGLAYWDRNIDNHILEGFLIDPASVTTPGPSSWKWIRNPAADLRAILVDVDSLIPSGIADESYLDLAQAVEETLSSGRAGELA